MSSNPRLPNGLYDLGQDQIANVITCLEMRAAPPSHAPGEFTPPLSLARFNGDMNAYRELFRRIGADWLWYSRLFMPDEKLSAILANPLVEAFILQRNGEGLGMLELDFREEGECELTFFGLTHEAIGTGLGRKLMDHAIALAWSKPITRLWVHTCTFDHPSAVRFYIRSGFKPYAFQIEVHPDPRRTGHLPPDAAPHIALIEA